MLGSSVASPLLGGAEAKMRADGANLVLQPVNGRARRIEERLVLVELFGDDDGPRQPRRLQDLDLAQDHGIRLDVGGRGVLVLGEFGQAVIKQDIRRGRVDPGGECEIGATQRQTERSAQRHDPRLTAGGGDEVLQVDDAVRVLRRHGNLGVQWEIPMVHVTSAPARRPCSELPVAPPGCGLQKYQPRLLEPWLRSLQVDQAASLRRTCEAIIASIGSSTRPRISSRASANATLA